jgi:hypothetical protein
VIDGGTWKVVVQSRSDGKVEGESFLRIYISQRA